MKTAILTITRNLLNCHCHYGHTGHNDAMNMIMVLGITLAIGFFICIGIHIVSIIMYDNNHKKQ